MLAQCQVHLPFRHDPTQISDPTHDGGDGGLTIFVRLILYLNLLLLLHASELCISNTVTTENKTNKLIFICRERSKIKYISLYIQDKHQVNWRDLSSFLTSYLRNLIADFWENKMTQRFCCHVFIYIYVRWHQNYFKMANLAQRLFLPLSVIVYTILIFQLKPKIIVIHSNLTTT